MVVAAGFAVGVAGAGFNFLMAMTPITLSSRTALRATIAQISLLSDDDRGGSTAGASNCARPAESVVIHDTASAEGRAGVAGAG